MKLQRAKRVTIWSLAFVLSFYFNMATSAGNPIQVPQGLDDSTGRKEREIVQTALERMTIEIARDYFTAKGMRFPKAVDSFTTLEEFLSGTYSDKNHELRVAVVNLHAYSDNFVDPNDFESVGNYLRNGIKRYAVNSKGKSLSYDKQKIAKIVDKASDEVNTLRFKPPGAGKTESVSTPARAFSPFDAITNFIRMHSLPLVGTLLTSNLILLLVIFWMHLRKERELTLKDVKPFSAVQTQVAKADNARIKATNRDEVSDQQKVLETQHRHEPIPVKEVEHAESILAANLGVHRSDWLIVRASVAGKLHVDSEPQIPCQDSNTYRELGKGWGIAVVCDGAGSKKFSHYGSRFVADNAAKEFGEIVEASDWFMNGCLPSDDDWRGIVKKILTQIRSELEAFSQTEHAIDVSLLSCTVIVVVHSPFGILASHVGDGRAAFCNESNQWKSMMKPHKGEEANQTVFITSIDGSEPDNYIESAVFRERPAAFTLMSDGCESHSFEVNIFDEALGKYVDPNRPYEKFFQPLISTLKGFYRSNAAPEEIGRKWENFIRAGNEKLRNEPDDKTMILGVMVKTDP